MPPVHCNPWLHDGDDLQVCVRRGHPQYKRPCTQQAIMLACTAIERDALCERQAGELGRASILSCQVQSVCTSVRSRRHAPPSNPICAAAQTAVSISQSALPYLDDSAAASSRILRSTNGRRSFNETTFCGRQHTHLWNTDACTSVPSLQVHQKSERYKPVHEAVGATQQHACTLQMVGVCCGALITAYTQLCRKL